MLQDEAGVDETERCGREVVGDDVVAGDGGVRMAPGQRGEDISP